MYVMQSKCYQGKPIFFWSFFTGYYCCCFLWLKFKINSKMFEHSAIYLATNGNQQITTYSIFSDCILIGSYVYVLLSVQILFRNLYWVESPSKCLARLYHLILLSYKNSNVQTNQQANSVLQCFWLLLVFVYAVSAPP